MPPPNWTYRGKPIFFSVLLPWTAPGRMVAPSADTVGRLLTTLSVVIAFTLLAVSLILARRQPQTGRGDRRALAVLLRSACSRSS
jgi:hypothetical protein